MAVETPTPETGAPRPEPYRFDDTGMERVRRDLEGARCAIVFERLEVGGAERQGLLLGQFLQSQGASVSVWGFRAGDASVARLCEENGIPWRLVRVRFGQWRTCPHSWLPDAARLLQALRQDRISVLLPYYSAANTACSLVWRATHSRVCVWNQRYEGITVSPRFELLAAKTKPVFVANSPGAARHLEVRLGVPRERIHIVPNGVAVEQPLGTPEEWRARLRIPSGSHMVCMVASLHSAKDHETLIRAWASICSVIHERLGYRPVLVLAGREGVTAPAARRLVQDLGIQADVRFTGFVSSDIAGLLRSTDLLVHSSLSEGCPNAILEAMAHGIPVVATDIPGIRWALGDDSAEFLVPPRDVAALAERVIYLLTDHDKRAAAGLANAERAQTHFTVEAMCGKSAWLITQGLRGNGV